MKKFFYLAFLMVVFISCSQSKEQKAEELIKENLKKTLYKPETYKPVDTKVDSAFAPYDDPAFFEELVELVEFNSKYRELEIKAKNAKSSMALWSGPYQTEYGKTEYREAKEQYDDANAKIERLKSKGKKQYEKFITMLRSERKFIGYKALHNYRADNNAGNTLIGNTIFFIDENFTEVRYSMDLDDYNQVQDAISEFKEQIEEATNQGPVL